MGMGSSQSSNGMYLDANGNQYYSPYAPQNPYGGNLSGIVANTMNRSNFLAAPKVAESMVPSRVDQARAAYNNILANIATNPAQNLSVMFPSLSMEGGQTNNQMGNYGAGRFLGQGMTYMSQAPMAQQYNYMPQPAQQQQQFKPSIFSGNFPAESFYMAPFMNQLASKSTTIK